MTRCSLIVLNYQGDNVLRRCLDSLVGASSADLDEIIVVDNASTDGSAAIAEEYGDRVRLVRRTENNFIFGLNDGVAVAQGHFIAFLNNDIVVEREFVERSLRHFDREDVFAVCPRILQMDGRDQGSITSAKWHRGLLFYDVHPHTDQTRCTFFAVGGQSFFDATKLRALDSIDPLFRPMYHEDIELSYRAWRAGWIVRYAGDAVVHHIGGHSSRARFTARQLRSFVRQNEHLIVWKNIDDVGLLLEHFAWMPFRMGVAIMRGDWATIQGLFAAIRRVPETLRARSRRRCLTISDRDVLRRTSPSELLAVSD